MNGVEHSVEVTAETLYEAVAQGLRAFRDAEWASNMGAGLTTITVTVKQPVVQHRVRVNDFVAWLEAGGRSPAEMSLKNRLRQLLEK